MCVLLHVCGVLGVRVGAEGLPAFRLMDEGRKSPKQSSSTYERPGGRQHRFLLAPTRTRAEQ